MRIRAAALNPVELHIWNGHFFDGPPRPPYVIGLEGVGVVEEGERLAPGTRVRVEYVHPGYGRDGAVAEYAVVPEEPDASDRASQASVAPIGDELDDTEAAALGVPVFTALMCLERAQRAGASLDGAHVLVTGATGAVGLVAVQLAKLMGAARVVAAGRNRERLERARSLGADATVELGDGRAAELATASRRPPTGASTSALDPLWGEPARAAIDALTRDGVYVSFGQAASPLAELSGIPMRNRRVTRGRPLGRVGHAAGAPGGAGARPRARASGAAPADARHRGARARGDRGRLGAALAVRRPEARGQAVTTSAETLPYPRFSDAEMARRRDALAAELEAAEAAHARAVRREQGRPGRRLAHALAGHPRGAVRVHPRRARPAARELLQPHPERGADRHRGGGALGGAEADGHGDRGARAPRRPRRARGGDRAARLQALRGALASSPRRSRSTTPTRACGCASRPRSSTGSAVGCEFTDDAVRAVHEQAGPGTDERELGNLAERAYVGRGGTTHIHYFGQPSVPAQWPAARTLERGDVLTCEISASYWDYTGQLLRTFAVADEPAPLYRELHDVADAAFDALFAQVRPGATAADLVEASA